MTSGCSKDSRTSVERELILFSLQPDGSGGAPKKDEKGRTHEPHTISTAFSVGDGANARSRRSTFVVTSIPEPSRTYS